MYNWEQDVYAQNHRSATRDLDLDANRSDFLSAIAHGGAVDVSRALQ
jgi:hypothetical protein